MKKFKDIEIKAGYLLVVKTGEKTHNMTVIPNDDDELGLITPGPIGAGGRWWPLSNHDENGVYEDSEIIAIYGPTRNKFLLDNSTERRTLLWKRETPAVDMTLEEIEKKLGHPVRIVKAENN